MQTYFFTTQNMTVGYNGNPLIKDIEIELGKGEILILIGPNGAGKSTILKSIIGQLSLLAGTVLVENIRLDRISEIERAKKVSVVLTERIQPEMMTCMEVVEMGRYPYTGKLGILSEEDKRIVSETMDLVHITDLADKEFLTLSDGQRQRVMLAKAIAQEPEILVLDEPTSFLDIRYKLEFLSVLQELTKHKNLTVIMSLHELDLAERISDKILCVKGEYIERFGAPDTVFVPGYIQNLYEITTGTFDECSGNLELPAVTGEPEVFVIAGNGSGTPLFRSLQRKGTTFAAGILWENDKDTVAAEALAVKVIKETAFCRIKPEKVEIAKREIDRCKAVICTLTDFGEWNKENEELMLYAEQRGKIKMSKVIMVQGTMSNAGKSLLCTGLCRVFAQDGYRAAPFKSQNMALNSYITEEGLEMGRAQVMQAEAAKIKPLVCMNPILLKPTTDMGSQVIVNGEVFGNMPAKEYFEYKKKLIPEIEKAFKKLETMADIIVIEGAGSPAEINLKQNDIVNMGMAELVDAPVLLVGDIDRGGVFAQLLGTLMLLEDKERERVKGLIINKFRGDKTILDPGISMIEEMGKVPMAGVVPYMQLSLEDEDSLTTRFEKKEKGLIDFAVVRYPRISNFTDFDVFEQIEDVSVRYVTNAVELGNPDMIFLPGSKNTMGDLKWMRENGLEAAVKKKAEDTIVFGICGGYQMLGNIISDRECVEEGGTLRGMELLPIETTLKQEKVRTQRKVLLQEVQGAFSELNGKEASGYEIHMGDTVITEQNIAENQVLVSNGNVYGTYLHGIFDAEGIASIIVRKLVEQKGILCDTSSLLSYAQFKETQYDKLADNLREYLDMDFIYGMLREARI